MMLGWDPHSARAAQPRFRPQTDRRTAISRAQQSLRSRACGIRVQTKPSSTTGQASEIGPRVGGPGGEPPTCCWASIFAAVTGCRCWTATTMQAGLLLQAAGRLVGGLLGAATPALLIHERALEEFSTMDFRHHIFFSFSGNKSAPASPPFPLTGLLRSAA